MELKCSICGHPLDAAQTRHPVKCRQCQEDLNDWLILKKAAQDSCAQGRELWRQGESVRAQIHLKDAIFIDDSLPEAKLLLAVIYRELSLEDLSDQTLLSLADDRRYSELANFLLGK